jgi:hypothetical protein
MGGIDCGLVELQSILSACSNAPIRVGVVFVKPQGTMMSFFDVTSSIQQYGRALVAMLSNIGILEYL